MPVGADLGGRLRAGRGPMVTMADVMAKPATCPGGDADGRLGWVSRMGDSDG